MEVLRFRPKFKTAENFGQLTRGLLKAHSQQRQDWLMDLNMFTVRTS